METDWNDLAVRADQALSAGRMADASRLFERIATLVPDQPENWFNLGHARRGARDFDGALDAYARALVPGDPIREAALVNRSVILRDDLGRIGEAEAELRQAIAISPQYVPAWFNLALLHEVVGRREEARAAYSEAVRADPLCAGAHARLAVLEADPERGIAHIVGVLRRGRFSQLGAAELEFALANTLDQAGRYDEAFAVISRANDRKAKLRRPQFRYDRGEHERYIDRLIAAFPARPQVPARDGDRRPVFVLGMFRSGSTVVEQWLSRLPLISAGGELEMIPLLVRERLQPYPQTLARLNMAEQNRMRGDYLLALDRVAPGAPHVTDKRCDNFLHIGLIKTLFPTAVIVHTAREPLDIALSTYFVDFADPISYTTSMPDIGHYLAQYRRLMSHWDRLFGDEIVKVEYEHFVSSPHAVLDPVCEALGISEAEFTADPRGGAIHTPSAWAARAPLNTKSIGRWRNYAKHLEPVREALGI
jgi:tetratricopeptide (TPR) repeat protein